MENIQHPASSISFLPFCLLSDINFTMVDFLNLTPEADAFQIPVSGLPNGLLGVSGLGGNDTIQGSPIADRIFGNRGADRLFGQEGADTIRGGSGSDELAGGIGNDSLAGDRGGDWLRGGAGDDELQGGPGDDVLIGGSGRDRLLGGPGPTYLRSRRMQQSSQSIAPIALSILTRWREMRSHSPMA
ncbi:MAG: calcium-binding protein [Microcoleus sp. SU_5_6]|nr:calcium-binding protein [Microcoleus sp. SU_5_6]